MAKLPEFDPIEYLLHRKFAGPPQTLADLSINLSLERLALKDPALARRMTEYSKQLRQMAPAELDAMVEAERKKQDEEAIARRAQEEASHFFNLPHAAADFEHWSKAEHWSLDEAIALLLGKAPEIVSWEKIKGYNLSPFVKRYGRLRDLTGRATAWKKLYDPVLPILFLKWAKDNEIAIPAELSEKVERLKGKSIDWKKRYEESQHEYSELRSMYDQHIADWKEVAQKQSSLIDAKQQQIEGLEAKLATAEKDRDASSSAKSQSPIERKNMLKAIYVLAKKGYGYDPTGKRSTIVPEIVSDLALEGLSLSEDTVRRYLNEARDTLAEWKEES